MIVLVAEVKIIFIGLSCIVGVFYEYTLIGTLDSGRSADGIDIAFGCRTTGKDNGWLQFSGRPVVHAFIDTAVGNDVCIVACWMKKDQRAAICISANFKELLGSEFVEEGVKYSLFDGYTCVAIVEHVIVNGVWGA